ncbi:MAG: hypothetical protein R3E83_02535 [Burkholderiaceae bacterium]
MHSLRFILAAVLAAGSVTASAADAGIRDFFWPDHLSGLKYKVRSHGLNGQFSMTLGETVEIGGKQYRAVQTTGQGYRVKRETIYMRADDQAIYARYAASPDAPEVIELKLPIEKGSHWSTVDRDGNPSEREITGIGPCKTREGLEFEHCVRVDYRWQELAAVSFFSPKSGEVIFSGANGFFNRRLLLP